MAALLKALMTSAKTGGSNVQSQHFSPSARSQVTQASDNSASLICYREDCGWRDFWLTCAYVKQRVVPQHRVCERKIAAPRPLRLQPRAHLPSPAVTPSMPPKMTGASAEFDGQGAPAFNPKYAHAPQVASKHGIATMHPRRLPQLPKTPRPRLRCRCEGTSLDRSTGFKAVAHLEVQLPLLPRRHLPWGNMIPLE